MNQKVLRLRLNETNPDRALIDGETTDLSDVGGDEVADELFHVVVDGASLLDGGNDRREVVVGKHHLRRSLGDCRARTHRDADLGLLQRRRVVDTVAGLREKKQRSTMAIWNFRMTFIAPSRIQIPQLTHACPMKVAFEYEFV